MDGQGEGATADGRTPTTLRALHLLEELARIGKPVTPTDVNHAIGLPKPTLHRLFASLEAEGFLQREMDGRSYSAGPRLRRVSTNVMSSLRIRTARLAVLGALAERIGETCNIAFPGREAMIYLDRVETKWPLRIQLPIGTEVPFHCTASGKMYLSRLNPAHLERFLNASAFAAHTPATLTAPEALRAEIERTRARGYALDAEEFIAGMIAVAMPIEDDRGRLVSTVSFHAPAVRLSLAAAQEQVPRLAEAARELSRIVQG